MNTRTPEVVIVDHDLEVLKSLVAPLRKEFEFYLTVSPNDALAALSRFPIKVLVAGQTLFTGTGLEVLNQAHRRSPATVRVLLVNAAERHPIEADLAAAELFYVLKRPCSAEQLKEVLQAAGRSAQVQATGAHVEHVVLESGHGPAADAPIDGDPVTVLTTDADLYEAIRVAVHGRHEVHLAAKLEAAAKLAASGKCAVLVTDLALTESALRRITNHLRAREEALVTVAVGNREQGNSLMGLLAAGTIHRFLLKPLTPGLARLALDSATRQHASLKAHRRAEAHFELRPAAPEAHAQAPAGPEPAVVPASKPRRLEWPIGRLAIIAGVALVLLAGIGIAVRYGNDREPPVDQRAVAIQSKLAAADAAARAGHLLDPATGSAYTLYTELLRLDPKNAAAEAGLDRITTRFLEQAESQLVEGKLDDAEGSLNSARQVRPENRRLKFLDAQLAKDRQEQLLMQARQSTTAGNLQEAKDLLQQAQHVESKSSEIASAQQAIESRARTQQVAQYLDLARQRVAQNRLVNPPDDSARYYLRTAQRLEPGNVAVQQGLRDLGDRVVSFADAAIDAQRFDSARTLISQAQDLGVEKAEIDRLNNRITSGVDSKTRGDLLALAVKRTEENRLLDPPQDNARYYLDRLTQNDPAFPGADKAAQALGAKLVARAQGSIASAQYDNATRMLSEARAVGYSGPDLASAETALNTAQAAKVAAAASPPKRVKYVSPTYPQDALSKGVEGWVDISFGVTASGQVVDVRVDDAKPRNQFDRAALVAVRQWKYEPTADGTALAQRLKTRVQFQLQD